MPTIITHSVLAGLAGRTFVKNKMPIQFWIIAMICSIFPDFDVIGFSLGIQYGDFLGHRGFFHSTFFALILGIFATFILYRLKPEISLSRWKMILFFFIVSASHGILDAFTNGGLGIALLSPFDNTRYFFPWTPILVSPLSIKNILSDWGLSVIIYEITYLWIPMIFIYLVSAIFNKIGRIYANSTL